MLAYLVLGLVVIYLILEFSGALRDLSERGSESNQGGDRTKRAGLDREIERRLKVFEDYLKKADDAPEDDR